MMLKQGLIHLKHRGICVAGGSVQNDVVNWSHLQMGLVEQPQIR
jgi:hypothetical protein